MRWFSLIFAVLMLAAPAIPASACPNCRESVATPPSAGVVADQPAIDEVSGLSGGFNSSIWVMLGGVVLSLGLVGTLVTHVARSPR